MAGTCESRGTSRESEKFERSERRRRPLSKAQLNVLKIRLPPFSPLPRGRVMVCGRAGVAVVSVVWCSAVAVVNVAGGVKKRHKDEVWSG